LAPLQEIPAFQALVARSKERRDEAVAQAAPPPILLQPSTAAGPFPLLIALHGNLGSAARFAPHWQLAADMGWMVALPESRHLGWVSGLYDWQEDVQTLQELET